MITKLTVKSGAMSLHVKALDKLWTFDLVREKWSDKKCESLLYNIAAEMEVIEASYKTQEAFNEKLRSYLKSIGLGKSDKIRIAGFNLYESIGGD